MSFFNKNNFRTTNWALSKPFVSSFTPNVLGALGVDAFRMGWNGIKNMFNRNKTQVVEDDAINNQIPLQQLPRRTVYSSTPARKKVSHIVNTFKNYKTRQTQNVNNPLQSFTLAKNAYDDSDDETAAERRMRRMMRQIERIQSGDFEYNDLEKRQLQEIRDLGKSLSQRQARANANYEGGVRMGEFRSGRSRYAQELADDAIYNSIQTGIDALNEIDKNMQGSILELEKAIRDDRINAILKQYGMISQYQEQKNQVRQKMIENMRASEKLQLDIQKANLAEYQNDYELAVSQGYTGSYWDFLDDLEKLKYKYKPVSTSSSSSSTPSFSTYSAPGENNGNGLLFQ